MSSDCPVTYVPGPYHSLHQPHDEARHPENTEHAGGPTYRAALLECPYAHSRSSSESAAGPPNTGWLKAAAGIRQVKMKGLALSVGCSPWAWWRTTSSECGVCCAPLERSHTDRVLSVKRSGHGT